jgi:hypothetical protein
LKKLPKIRLNKASILVIKSKFYHLFHKKLQIVKQFLLIFSRLICFPFYCFYNTKLVLSPFKCLQQKVMFSPFNCLQQNINLIGVAYLPE